MFKIRNGHDDKTKLSPAVHRCAAFHYNFHFSYEILKIMFLLNALRAYLEKQSHNVGDIMSCTPEKHKTLY